jgi:hypothetical protein
LRERGWLLVGIDVIDGHVTEINLTSPARIRAIARLGGPDVAVKSGTRSRPGGPENNVSSGRYAPDTFSRRPSPRPILLASFQKRAQPVAPVQSDNQVDQTWRAASRQLKKTVERKHT